MADMPFPSGLQWRSLFSRPAPLPDMARSKPPENIPATKTALLFASELSL